MKRIMIILLFSFSLHAQWVAQSTNTNSELIDLYFHNINTGWVCGSSGAILRTTNGGNQWNIFQFNPDYRLNSISFSNENTGYVSGSYSQSFQFVFSVVLKTVNGGENWTTVSSLTGFNDRMSITSVNFFNANTGIRTQSGSDGFSTTGSVMKTTNGGLNWNFLSFPGYISFRKAVCMDQNTAFVLGFYNTDVPGYDTLFVFRSTDAGQSWNEVYRARESGLNSINVSNGIVSLTGINPQTLNGKIVRSQTIGNTWDTISNNTIPEVRGCYFLNPTTGWAVGFQEKILYTANGGLTWSIQNQSQQNPLNNIQMFPSCTGWAIGSSGKVLNTTSCGIMGISNISTESPLNFSLSQNYPNPFNPATQIGFRVAESGLVRLTVFDMLGKEVEVLFNEELQPGSYETEWNASAYPSGVYYYKIQAGAFTETKKMVLIK